MPRRPAKVTQADIARAIRAAKEAAGTIPIVMAIVGDPMATDYDDRGTP